MKNRNTVVLLSGGLDSTTLLYHCIRDARKVKALAINYNQRHQKEIECARNICESHTPTIPFDVLDLRNLTPFIKGHCALVDRKVPVPFGGYEEESMKATVVPNRNMILLALAIGHAISIEFSNVAYAAHAGDHAIYPDCRPIFVEKMRKAASICDWTPIEILTPFVEIRKEEIVKLGASYGVPFEKTWSCYQGEEYHCGRCGTCVERQEAFRLAGVVDPTIYEPKK